MGRYLSLIVCWSHCSVTEHGIFILVNCEHSMGGVDTDVFGPDQATSLIELQNALGLQF